MTCTVLYVYAILCMKNWMTVTEIFECPRIKSGTSKILNLFNTVYYTWSGSGVPVPAAPAGALYVQCRDIAQSIIDLLWIPRSIGTRASREGRPYKMSEIQWFCRGYCLLVMRLTYVSRLFFLSIWFDKKIIEYLCGWNWIIDIQTIVMIYVMH